MYKFNTQWCHVPKDSTLRKEGETYALYLPDGRPQLLVITETELNLLIDQKIVTYEKN